MESATLSHRTIDIDGMSGDACVKKVTDALTGVKNIKTESVTVGSASISADQTGCDAACLAIDNAGYASHGRSPAHQKDAKPSTPDALKPAPVAEASAYKGIGEHAAKPAKGYAPAEAPSPAAPGAATRHKA